MLPVLDLDPAVEPAAAIEAVAVLRDQPLQPHQAGVPEQVRANLALLEWRSMDAVDTARQQPVKVGLAHRQRQSPEILAIEACFERSPILKQLIANRTADALELTNGITLEVRPASFRKLRGPTYIAVIADELAFWYVDAAYANPDVEILNAVEPGLATTGGPLILASSPHARRGALWEYSNATTAQMAIR